MDEIIDFPEFYEQYGRKLAERLTGHTDAVPTFVFVEDLGDPKEVLAFLTAKRTDQPLLLVWESFEEDWDNGGRDNYHSVITGSIAFLEKASRAEDIRDVHAQTRELLKQALARMIDDSLEGDLYGQGIQVELRNMPCEKISRLATNWYGYGLRFRWTVPLYLNAPP